MSGSLRELTAGRGDHRRTGPEDPAAEQRVVIFEHEPEIVRVAKPLASLARRHGRQLVKERQIRFIAAAQGEVLWQRR